MLSRRALALALEYAQLTAGAVCIALSVDLFLVPNNIVSGGVTGIAQMMHTAFGTPIGLVALLINIPLFVLGWRYLGGVVFGARTLYATVLLSILIDTLASRVHPVALGEPLLYVFYGGLLDGIGIGLVFRARGTTGGIDIVARFLQQWRGVRPGQGMLALSAAVFVLAGWVYGATPVLYALLVAYISGRVVDIVIGGFTYARAVLIISSKSDAIRAGVLNDLGRGITVLQGEGGYTAIGQQVLLCVIAQSEESFLKALIWDIDPTAFVVINEATEVLGEGFKPGRGR
jgi:uncharacterized membrane-anchored protein YitT (DUF2179 family)